MSMQDPRNQNTVASWITSLAISVTCCSILFVIFAGYISDWKDSLTAMRVRFETINERLNEMNGEIDNLRRHATVQQIQIMPAPNGASIQLPVSLAPAPEGRPPAAAQPNAPAATPPATAPAAPAKP